MERKEILEALYTLVAPSHPNDWEAEEVADCLVTLPERQCAALLQQIPVIWPISHSLSYAFLRQGAAQAEMLPLDLLPEWVRKILHQYESGGLRAAESFMADLRGAFLARRSSVSEVALESLRVSMQHYIRGVSGESLLIGESPRPWTDTETIYVPQVIDIFGERWQNRLIYTFLVSYQWVLTTLPLFSADSPWKRWAKEDRDLLRLYLLVKGCGVIRETFPGLWRRSVPLLQAGLADNGGVGKGRLQKLLTTIWGPLDSPEDAGLSGCGGVDLTEFSRFAKKHGRDESGGFGPFAELLLGELNFSAAERIVHERREKERQALICMLARAMPKGVADRIASEEAAGNEPGRESGVVLMQQALKEAVGKQRMVLQIDNSLMQVPEELLRLVEKMLSTSGDIPLGYVQAAAGVAGQGRMGDSGREEVSDAGQIGGQEGYLYDEWDCRRNGYRHNWCTVIEEQLPVNRSTFIHQTLAKHGGLLKRLRAQFELMATSHRFVRRQRDGDDLDLDAIIDAMGDSRAGKVPDDRLFVRLLRNERSIATLFLIDMSNSTAGWVGTLIKESLVLLCEAMEKVGDRYGIYGFSGMKRSRCKLYPVKELDEPYDGDVRDRISAIGPREYTRMAPAIRHLSTLLDKAATRSRLLITLSDGKPEDYDGYSGEYAIEDTRKALQEARGRGISPFCITIDKRAHDYLEHMFGAGSYTFINRIDSLPARMAQIYWMLTR